MYSDKYAIAHKRSASRAIQGGADNLGGAETYPDTHTLFVYVFMHAHEHFGHAHERLPFARE